MLQMKVLAKYKQLKLHLETTLSDDEVGVFCGYSGKFEN